MQVSGKCSPWQVKLAGTSLFACCLLPFLVPLHTQPIPSFYAEWLSLAFGLAGLPILIGRSGLNVPRIALLPLLLIVLLLFQYPRLEEGLHTLSLTAGLYLLWAFLLMLIATALVEQLGMACVATWLARAILIAALVNACSVILFHTGVRGGLDWLFFRPDLRANLAQTNQLADFLWLGIVSLLYCWQRSETRGWLWAMLLPVLLVASALTGSRSPMLYSIGLVVLAWLLGNGRLKAAAVFTAVIYFALVWVVHLVLAAPLAGGDSVSRMMASASFSSGGNIRLGLIAMATQIFLVNPLLGAGWGSFAWASYQRVGPELGWQGTAEHAHQLLFHLAAEMGVVAPILVLVLLGLWAWPQWQARISLRLQPEAWWAVAAASVVLLHAQLEYPLWYAHFLGVAAILLVCAERKTYQLQALRISGVMVVCVLATGLYLLVSSGRDYVRLEHWLYSDMQRRGREIPAGHYQLLVDLHRGSLMQPQASRMLAAVMPPTADQLVGKRDVCRMALLSEPQTPSVFTCALLDQLAGDPRAKQAWQQALLVFESDAPAYVERLETTLTASELEALRPMLEHIKPASP